MDFHLICLLFLIILIMIVLVREEKTENRRLYHYENELKTIYFETYGVEIDKEFNVYESYNKSSTKHKKDIYLFVKGYTRSTILNVLIHEFSHVLCPDVCLDVNHSEDFNRIENELLETCLKTKRIIEDKIDYSYPCEEY